MLTVSINDARKFRPCAPGWRATLKSMAATYGNTEQVPLKIVLDHVGFDNTLWVLCAVEGHEQALYDFAYQCAERSQLYFQRFHPGMEIQSPQEAANQFVADKMMRSQMVLAWKRRWMEVEITEEAQMAALEDFKKLFLKLIVGDE